MRKVCKETQQRRDKQERDKQERDEQEKGDPDLQHMEVGERREVLSTQTYPETSGTQPRTSLQSPVMSTTTWSKDRFLQRPPPPIIFSPFSYFKPSWRGEVKKGGGQGARTGEQWQRRPVSPAVWGDLPPCWG